jgi:rhomboid protease GluP
MLDWGAAYTPCIVEEGETYRIFTSMFLHFGIEHLINNMLVLFVLGSRLERVIGSLRFAVIYFLGGIAGNVVSLLYDLKQGEAAVSAGASGAVFAVMGGMILVVLCNKGRLEDLSMRQILVLAVFSLYFGFTSSGVDNAAHLGGFLAGFILAVIVYHPRRKT